MLRNLLILACCTWVAGLARAQSANNHYASATVVTILPYLSGNVAVGANNKEVGEPNHAGLPGGRSAWWVWTPAVSGVMKISTVGSPTDTLLAVYSNSVSLPAPSQLLAECNNLTTTTTTSELRLRVVSGTTYRIAVDTVNAAAGNVSLRIESEPSPAANDQFASAALLSGAFPLVSASVGNLRTTVEPNEPLAHVGRGPQPTAWYKFTPAADAVVAVTVTSAAPTLFAPQWAVYTGASVGSLARVGGRFPFSVDAGTTYYLQVSGYGFHSYSKEGLYTVRVEVAPLITSIVLPAESEWEWMHPLSSVDPTTDPNWASSWIWADDFTTFNGHAFNYYARAPLGFGLIDAIPGNRTDIGTPSQPAHNNAAYFRTSMIFPTSVASLWAEVLADDGAYVYLDGNPGIPVNLASPEGFFAPSALAKERSLHTASRLANGKVLVVGGTDGISSLPSAELFDPATGFWTSTGSLIGARHQHTATLLPNGKVLVVGGMNGTSFVATAELYDPATGLWTAATSPATARRSHTAVLLNDGRVLVSGGAGSAGVLNTSETYNPTTGLWSTIASLMPSPREKHIAVLLANGKVLSSGGYSGTAVRTSSELFDPVANTWTATGALPAGRQLQTATLLPNGKVLATGGDTGAGAALNTCILFDPALGTWAATGNLGTARSGHSANLLPNGKVMVSGGFNGATVHATCELYDPAAGTWSATAAIAPATSLHTATSLADGRVLLAGGANGATRSTTSLLYSQVSSTWVLTSTTAATTPICGASTEVGTETQTRRILLNPSGAPVPAGFHNIAVSVHQTSNTSDDLGFDLMLYEAPPNYGRAFPGQTLYTRFNEPSVGATSHAGAGTELGWTLTGNSSVQVESSVAANFQVAPTTNKFLRVLHTNLDPFVSQAVDISGLSTYKAAVKLRSFTTSTSGFESPDFLEVYLETSQDGVNFTPAAILQSYLVGGGLTPDSILFQLGPPELYTFNTRNPEWTERRLRMQNNTAKSARIVAYAKTDSTSEHIFFDDVGFEKVGCRIFAFVRERTYDNQGDDILANDTWSFNPMIVSEDASAGWIASTNNFTGGNPVTYSGNYGDPAVIGPLPVAGGAVQTVVFRDASAASCTVTVSGSAPACKLGPAVVTNLIRDPGPSEPASDDFFTFDLTVTGANASTGWTISNASLPGGATGLYNTPTRLTMPLTPNPRTLVIADRANPSCTVSVSITGPPSTVYEMAYLQVPGKEPIVVYSDPSELPPPAWKSPSSRVLVNTNGGGILSTFASEWVDLRNYIGAISFTGTLVAAETSTDSNFEALDRLGFVLQLDDGFFANTNNFTALHPRNLNGDAYLNGGANPAADEFNVAGLPNSAKFTNSWPTVYTIPDNIQFARVIVTGDTDSGSERFEVRDVLFTVLEPNQDQDGDGMFDGWENHFLGSTAALPGDDLDGDGLSNYGEFLAGTDPDDILEVLYVATTAVQGNDLVLTWSSRRDRFYQIVEADSPEEDLEWLDVGDPVRSQGDFQTTVTLPDAAALSSNRYYRVKVLP